MMVVMPGYNMMWFGESSSGSNLESGVSAIEDAMTKRNETESSSFPAGSDLRIGTSADTVATPDDFPAAYNYGTGKIEDYSRTAMLQKDAGTSGQCDRAEHLGRP